MSDDTEVANRTALMAALVTEQSVQQMVAGPIRTYPVAASPQKGCFGGLR